MDLTVTTGQFKKNTVTGGKKADSISFGSGAKINKSTSIWGQRLRHLRCSDQVSRQNHH